MVVVLITYGISGCGYRGLNSLPLPGTQDRRGSSIFHVEVSNVAMLESNSPVLIDDVVVGTVGEMRLRNWHADVEVFVRPDAVVPANAVATVGQTSLLGSMHLELDPPIGVAPQGRLQPGTTIPLNRSSTYPSTERTLSTLSAVVNGGDSVRSVMSSETPTPHSRDGRPRSETCCGDWTISSVRWTANAAICST